MRKTLIIIMMIVFIMVMVLCIYESSWIKYNIQKRQMDSIEFIRFYSTRPFSYNVKVISIEYEKGVFLDDEIVKAILLVPTNEIDNLIPINMRQYDALNDNKNIEFSCSIMKAVHKLFVTTQRTIHFTVTESEEGYNKVFLYIDNLGWRG